MNRTPAKYPDGTKPGAGFALVGILVLVTGISGCCRLPRKTGPEPTPLPESLALIFPAKENRTFDEVWTGVRTNRSYRIDQVGFKVEDSAIPGQEKIVFDYYQPARTGPRPALLILPISGGGYELERYFARYFARRGLAALIVHREKFSRDQDLIEGINAMLRQTVHNHRRVVDWIETRPELDAGRIGVFGASLGGIKGALLTPLEPRIQAAVLGLAGGDLPFILIHSNEPGIERRREALLKRREETLEQLHGHLKEWITFDPLRVAPHVDPNKVLLILARYDRAVPYAKGLELRERMGYPETAVVPAGHYSALVYLPYIQSKAYRFFKKRFDNSP